MEKVIENQCVMMSLNVASLELLTLLHQCDKQVELM